MKKLGRLSQILETPLETGAGIFLILILVLVFSEVVSRYVFAASHGFMEEFSKWSQIWMAYLILGVIEKRRRHVGVDILPRRIPEKYRNILLIVTDAMALIFAAVLCWAGVGAIQLAHQLGLHSTTTVPTPMWIVRLCIPLGAVFLAFFSIEHLIIGIRSLGKHRGDKE